MKVTNRLTHIATKVNFETAKTEDQLKAAFEAKGIAGFPAMLDIKERTEEHVQFIALDDLLAFAKASGVAAVTYDVTYFPHADQGEVERQLTQLGRDLEISAEVIKDVCASEIQEYLDQGEYGKLFEYGEYYHLTDSEKGKFADYYNVFWCAWRYDRTAGDIDSYLRSQDYEDQSIRDS